jgi:hypothetical protein
MNFDRVFAVALIFFFGLGTALAQGTFQNASSSRYNSLSFLMPMKAARVGHSMVALPNGHVLVAGGAYGDLGTTQDVETFIPSRRTFVKAKAQHTEPRMGATLTLLRSGETLVAGGANDSEMALASAEIIRRNGNSLLSVGNMAVARSGHSATLLPNGRVLVLGGFDGSSVLSSAELFDPSTRTFIPLLARLTVPRSGHTATLINNRFVLIAGGESNTDEFGFKSGWAPLASAEVFDLRDETFEFTKNVMSSARLYHQATVIDANRVLLSGGIRGVAKGNASADIFVTSTLKFEPVQAMQHERSMHSSTRLINGDVLLCGGVEEGIGTASCEVFVSTKGEFQEAKPLAVPRWGHAAIELPNGEILFSGGMSNDSVSPALNRWGPSLTAEISSDRF